MSVKAKRIIKKLISWSGIFFFILAVGMLYWQLRHYSFREILHTLWNIPFGNLVAACVACLTGYVALSFYDYLALRYVGKRLSWWKWMLAGVLGFAVSNNAGHAVVSGGAVRYRLYTRWRIRAGDIIKMLTFSGFTYFLGLAAIVVAGYFLVPGEIFDQTNFASVGMNVLFGICGAALAAYFIMTILFRNKTVKIINLEFRVPTTEVAIFQTFLGAMDSVLAGLVLYFVLIPFVEIPFTTFIGVFVIAQATGVFSQVPGGIGVFETVFMLALPGEENRAIVFAALIAFRIIYYLVPLLGTGMLFLIYENNLRSRMRRWMAEAKATATNVGHRVTERATHVKEYVHDITHKQKKNGKKAKKK